jgi:hypothetical protein
MTSERQGKISVVKPPVIPIFCRTLVLLLALLASVFAAACWKAYGLDWLLADGKVPLLTCPHAIFTAKIGDGGDFCEMEMSYAVDLWGAIAVDPVMSSSCRQPLRPEDPIVCKLNYPCDSACSYNGGVCPDPEIVPQVTVYGQEPWQCIVASPSGFNRAVQCRRIELMPYCDSGFNVTPGAIVAIRGLIFGAVLITLIWFIAEFILRAVDIRLRKETAYGHMRQKETLPKVKAELRALIERRWAEQYEASKRESGYAGSVYGSETPRMGGASSSAAGTPRSAYGGSTAGGQGYRSALESRNPQRRFESSAWQRRLEQWRDLKSRKSSVYKSKVLLRSIGLNLLFFATVVSTMYLIIYISPAKISGAKSIINTLIDDLSIWRIHSWLDALIFVDLLLDVFLFVLACCVVHWPRAPVFAKHRKLEAVQTAVNSDNGTGSVSLSMSMADDEDDLEDAFSLESVLKQTMNSDTCLMIACHQSTLTEEKQAAFTNTLQCALKVFPPSHIFVCDNGNSICPVDATQTIAQSIHPDINYLYIPEGNKTFAFYWCNRYWIPFLAQCGRVPDFRYSLITDDDVPLPADLHIVCP